MKMGCDAFSSSRDNSYRRGSDNLLSRQSRVKGARRRRRIRGSCVIMAQLASYKAKVPPSTGNRLTGRYVTQRERYSDCCTWTCTMKLALSSGTEGDEERGKEIEGVEEERGEGIDSDCGNRRKEKEKE